ncbi:MAG: hypothetical protein QOF21_269 [Actinomycetota bacterium]
MKIFVAGATGVMGHRAVRELVASGHDVTALARTPEKAALVESLGGTPVTFDVFDKQQVLTHASGHDAVVNLLTHIPNLSKAALKGSWNENARLRTEASANLADAALEGGGRFLQESISFLYKDGGDAWLTEESPWEATELVQSTNDAEANANRVTERGGAGVVMRFGQFYAPEAAHTHDQVRAAKLGVAAAVGDPDGYSTYLYADDGARAVVAALSAPAGTYNVCEDDPMTRREGSIELAHALGKKKARIGLAKVLAKAIGSQGSLLARSNRVSNAKFKQATGWAPQVASQREGWPLIVHEMKELDS